MEVTFVGWAVGLVGFYLTIVSPRRLSLLVVFFAPFSATAVVNVPALTLGLQPFHFLGLLLFLRTGFDVVARRTPQPPATRASTSRRLAAFVLFTGASLLVPAFAEEATWFHFSQFLYVLSGAVIAIAVARAIRSPKDLRDAYITLALSGVFVASWSAIQYFAYRLDYQYPAWVFNNSASSYSQGYLQAFSEFGVTRLSSVAVEPSVLSRFALVVFVISAGMYLAPRSVVRDSWRVIFVVSAVACATVMVASTSTTGIVMLVLAVAALAIRYRSRSPLLFVYLLPALVLPLTHNRGLLEAILLNTLDKMSTSSFSDRLQGFEGAIENFLRSPLWGAGWGGSQSFDLVSHLLGSLGVIGVLLFIWLLASLRKPETDSYFGASYPDKVAVQHLVNLGGLALAMALAADAIVGFSYVFGPLWILLACQMTELRSSERMPPHGANVHAAT